MNIFLNKIYNLFNETDCETNYEKIILEDLNFDFITKL